MTEAVLLHELPRQPQVGVRLFFHLLCQLRVYLPVLASHLKRLLVQPHRNVEKLDSVVKQMPLGPRVSAHIDGFFLVPPHRALRCHVLLLRVIVSEEPQVPGPQGAQPFESVQRCKYTVFGHEFHLLARYRLVHRAVVLRQQPIRAHSGGPAIVKLIDGQCFRAEFPVTLYRLIKVRRPRGFVVEAQRLLVEHAALVTVSVSPIPLAALLIRLLYALLSACVCTLYLRMLLHVLNRLPRFFGQQQLGLGTLGEASLSLVLKHVHGGQPFVDLLRDVPHLWCRNARRL
mmetsp:Transcript_12472/g.26276  ORF Transcript_12472/g.26276 Transcript_12472/m.26276 type:complete len:287 (+) Transcript_12472:688-1548(+)